MGGKHIRVRQNKVKSKKGRKIALSILIFILLMITGVCVYGYSLLNRINPNHDETVQVDINKPVNILLLGVDAGDYDNKTSKNPKRSDTMIVVRYIPETDKVYMLSLPRDTRVTINGEKEKLNSAHRIGGVKLAKETIEKMLDIKIDYYAKVDYAGFRNCIDALGGVDIEIPFNMDYDAYGINIHFNKGETVHMDGKKAEEFVRWRKNNDGTGYAMGDLGRASTQQKFMLKLLEKLKTPAGIVRIPAIIETASKYVTTDMNATTILKYLTKIKGIEVSQIENKVLQGDAKYIGIVSYFIYDKEKNIDFLKNFNENITAEVKTTEKEIDKSQVKVEILNSTNKKGLASLYKEELEKLGYKVVAIGNYDEKQTTTIVKDYSKMEYGNTLVDDLGFGEIHEEEDGSKSILLVILGEDSIK